LASVGARAQLAMGCGPTKDQKADKAGQELVSAAERGDVDGLQSLLEKRGNVNWSEAGKSYTPLMSACWNRQSDAALLLIRKGARVNVANAEYGSTPLHMASFHGLADVVNALLACEADFDATNTAGQTPLDDAQKRGHKEIVRILREKKSQMLGFDANAGRVLLNSAAVGDMDRVKAALGSAADPNFSQESDNWTPLMAALWAKHEPVACFLMDNNAEINIANKQYGSTPLHLACRLGLGKATQMLMDKGANTKASDKNGKVPIEEARANNHAHIIEMFDGGAAMNYQQTGGSTAGCLPDHWTTPGSPGGFGSQGWMAIWLEEGSPIFENLQNVLNTDGSQLGQGRDVVEKGTYSSLSLKCAWRIENLGLWKRYATERTIVTDEIGQRGFSVPNLTMRKELADVVGSLPEVPDGSMNEVALLHGVKPDTVLTLLQNGPNMRFSHGNFGQGTYLAEDAGKSDQYCAKDAGDDPLLEEMHTRLYRKDGKHVDHPGDIYYVVLVRTIMGYFVRTLSGKEDAKDMDFAANVFATTDRRELGHIPGVVPPVHYHSMVVELGAAVKRFREFVQFHEARMYPEYLLAYQRV